MASMSFGLHDEHSCFQLILSQEFLFGIGSIVKIMQRNTTVLRREPHLAVTSGAYIESTFRLSPVARRDLPLLFFFSWLATLLPLMPHQVPTLWLWGTISGIVLLTTAWLLFHLGRRPSAIWSLTGCVALIGIGCLFDFWRLSPIYLLSQCRTSVDADFFTKILRHIEFHHRFFPVTTVTMLLWICLRSHARAEVRLGPGLFGGKPGLWKVIHRNILPRFGSCLLMLLCMGITMSVFESLGATVQNGLSADGIVSAMLCGMSLYHLVLNLYLRLSVSRTMNSSLER